MLVIFEAQNRKLSPASCCCGPVATPAQGCMAAPCTTTARAWQRMGSFLPPELNRAYSQLSRVSLPRRHSNYPTGEPRMSHARSRMSRQKRRCPLTNFSASRHRRGTPRPRPQRRGCAEPAGTRSAAPASRLASGRARLERASDVDGLAQLQPRAACRRGGLARYSLSKAVSVQPYCGFPAWCRPNAAPYRWLRLQVPAACSPPRPAWYVVYQELEHLPTAWALGDLNGVKMRAGRCDP
jgi:hypothetical protein